MNDDEKPSPDKPPNLLDQIAAARMQHYQSHNESDISQSDDAANPRKNSSPLKFISHARSGGQGYVARLKERVSGRSVGSATGRANREAEEALSRLPNEGINPILDKLLRDKIERSVIPASVESSDPFYRLLDQGYLKFTNDDVFHLCTTQKALGEGGVASIIANMKDVYQKPADRDGVIAFNKDDFRDALYRQPTKFDRFVYKGEPLDTRDILIKLEKNGHLHTLHVSRELDLVLHRLGATDITVPFGKSMKLVKLSEVTGMVEKHPRAFDLLIQDKPVLSALEIVTGLMDMQQLYAITQPGQRSLPRELRVKSEDAAAALESVGIIVTHRGSKMLVKIKPDPSTGPGTTSLVQVLGEEELDEAWTHLHCVEKARSSSGTYRM